MPPRHLLLIDTVIPDYLKIVNAINATDVSYVLFNSFTDTYSGISSSIVALGIPLFDTMGIVQEGSDYQYYHFIGGEQAIIRDIQIKDPTLSSWSGFKVFIQSIITSYGITTLDLIGCCTYVIPDWKYIVDNLESDIPINIRASTNLTGNPPNGDWLMESEIIPVNIKDVYFTNAISNYTNILYYNTHYWKSSGMITPTNIANNNISVPTPCSIVTWGNPLYGGDSNGVSGELINSIKIIASTEISFAAINTTGGVITWGLPDAGGDSTLVQPLLTNVIAIASTKGAFAALKSDKTVVTWGYSSQGGDSTLVQPLINVVAIAATGYAFAALKGDGSVVTWGASFGGGDSDSVQSSLIGVTAIAANPYAFVAINGSNTAIAWGYGPLGGNSGAVDTTNVKSIASTSGAFAVIKYDGTVVSWGDPSFGGNAPGSLSNVVKLVPDGYAFAAIKGDGTVVAWGDAGYGGLIDGPTQLLLVNISNIESTEVAFAAINTTGGVITWGDAPYGGDSSLVQSDLTNVTTISSTWQAFAALRADGRVITWGNSLYGGDSTSVSAGLSSGITGIASTYKAFAAIKTNGPVVTWGDPFSGSNSSGVSNELVNISAIASSWYAFAAFKSFNSPIVCFKDGTKILTNEGYKPIQDLRKGELIKTLKHGFLPIDMIGKRDIYHPALQERIKDQLYKCSNDKYNEVFEPLIITGCHSILVDNFIDEEQKKTTIEVYNKIYVTDNKYRLPACADKRSSVYEIPGTYTIYHLALENADYYMNYGIYANGLLVETCSKRYLKELSNMTLIE